jgi:hypothetical protein
MMGGLTRLCLLAALLAGPGAACAQAGGAPIRFSSSPPGAKVCKKTGRHLECLGETPLAVGVDGLSGNRTVDCLITKLGYVPVVRTLSAKEREIRVALRKADLFYDPAKQSSALAPLQRRVNAALSRLIYATRGVDPGVIALAGERTVLDGRDGVTLDFPLVISDPDLQTVLRRASRRHEDRQRHREVFAALEKARVFAFMDRVARAVEPLALAHLDFEIAFPTSRARLGERQITTYDTRWIGSRYENQAGQVVRIDSYETRARQREFTTVENTSGVAHYRFEVPMSLFKGGAPGRIYDELRAIDIRSDNFRRGKYAKVRF